MGQISTHKSQSIQTGWSMVIDASRTSIQSAGQTATQVLQKSHLFSIILIIFY